MERHNVAECWVCLWNRRGAGARLSHSLCHYPLEGRHDPASSQNITQLLRAWSQGDSSALSMRQLAYDGSKRKPLKRLVTLCPRHNPSMNRWVNWGGPRL